LVAESELEADLRATLAARRELGEEYDAELTKSFLEKLDREVDVRVEQALAIRNAGPPVERVVRRRRGSGARLAVVSIVLGIPVSAVVASNLHGTDSLVGVIVAWGSITAINVIQAIERRAGT
jgi:hypothetical protein